MQWRHTVVVVATFCSACTTPSSSVDSDGGAASDAAMRGHSDAGATGQDAAQAPDAALVSDAALFPDAAASADAAVTRDAAFPPDAAMTPDAAVAVDAGGTPWRTSFHDCWNTSSCRRALLLSHGGEWGGGVPYGSHSAHVTAAEHGADAVKVDVRVSMDGVPMVVHSSPFELYETLGCSGQKIEEMTAAQVGNCRMFPSATETFPRLDDTINWARGRINLMFTVKETRDFPAAMALALSLNATDYVLLEVGMQDISTNLPALVGFDQFFYDVQLDNLGDLTTLLALPPPPGVLMVAMDLNEFTEPQADIANAITSLVLPAGLHALTPSDKLVATVDDHLHRFSLGYDVLYTYNLPNGLMARPQVNMMRGVSPP